MNNILLVFKLGALFLSNLGYWEYFTKKSGMSRCFAPAFTVCFQITLLYFAGILHVLYFMAIGLLLVGWILLVRNFKSFNALSCFDISRGGGEVMHFSFSQHLSSFLQCEAKNSHIMTIFLIGLSL